MLWFERIPDFKSNQEENVQITRRALLTTVVAMVPFVLFGLFVERLTTRSKKELCSPRFRLQKPYRWNLADKNFQQGFFQNSQSKVVHYAAPTPTIYEKSNTKNTTSPRKEGIYLSQKIKTEKTARSAMLCSSQEKIPRQSNKPDSGLVFRDIGNVSQSKLKEFSANELLVEWQRAHNKRTLKNNSTRLNLNKTRFVFAVEQYALQQLQQPKTQENIDRLCVFLFEAIQAREGSADMIRLFDLLAALSVRYNKKDLLAKVQDKAVEFGRKSQLPVFFERATRWKSDKWQKRWLAKANRTWSGLPM